MISINITINDSYLKKINPQTYTDAIGLTIKQTTFEAESRCKKECPVRTGTLMRGHSSTFSGLNGSVSNGVEYAEYVIYGTKYQSANNYPERVVNSLESDSYVESAFSNALSNSGIL